jgi:hypothetical protein
MIQVKQRWLLLIYQLPPKPDYVRVKISRRMARIGAIPIKSTVYVLPNTESSAEDFRWTLEDIAAAGGEANLCSASLLGGLRDQDVEELFRQAREADYAALMEQTYPLSSTVNTAEARWRTIQELHRLQRRFEEIRAIDFFAAPGALPAGARLGELAATVHDPDPRPIDASLPSLSGRSWVTRAGVQVDRMASAWLIRRFIDPRARFRFVRPPYQVRKTEIRFDMYEAEFTHHGDRCTFEVLLERRKLSNRALHAIGEVVHDIDLKDNRYGRPETAGLAALLAGVTAATAADAGRLTRSRAIFDDLYRYYQRRK